MSSTPLPPLSPSPTQFPPKVHKLHAVDVSLVAGQGLDFSVSKVMGANVDKALVTPLPRPFTVKATAGSAVTLSAPKLTLATPKALPLASAIAVDGPKALGASAVGVDVSKALPESVDLSKGLPVSQFAKGLAAGSLTSDASTKSSGGSIVSVDVLKGLTSTADSVSGGATVDVAQSLSSSFKAGVPKRLGTVVSVDVAKSLGSGVKVDVAKGLRSSQGSAVKVDVGKGLGSAVKVDVVKGSGSAAVGVKAPFVDVQVNKA